MLQNHEIRNRKRRNVTSLHQENYKIDTPPKSRQGGSPSGSATGYFQSLPAPATGYCRLYTGEPTYHLVVPIPPM